MVFIGLQAVFDVRLSRCSHGAQMFILGDRLSRCSCGVLGPTLPAHVVGLVKPHCAGSRCWAALSLIELFLLEDHNAIYELIPRPGLFPYEGFDQLTKAFFLLMYQGGGGVADRRRPNPRRTADRSGTDPGGTAD